MTVELLTAGYRSLDDIKWLVVHHSATPSGNVETFRRYHVDERGYDDVAYHYVICNGNGGPDGEVQQGRPLEKVGAHAYGANAQSVGICLVGDFMKSRPTAKQWQSLIDLCQSLMVELNIPASNVIGHKEVPKFFNVVHPTNCPGDNLSPSAIREALVQKKSDFAGHYAENSVRRALELSLMHGQPDGTFAPDRGATRAELAIVAVNVYDALLKLLRGNS